MHEWRAVTDGPATAVNPAIYIESFYAVGMLYWTGQGVPQDYERARGWLQKAADMNHPGAQSKLGYMYTDGLSVQQDLDRAFQWFSRAARNGNVDGQYNLGIFYLNGWGTQRDVTMAKQYLAAASAQGDPGAEAALQRLQQGDMTAMSGDFPFVDPPETAEAEVVSAEAEPGPVGGRLAADAEVVSADAASEFVGGRSAADAEVVSADAASRAERAPTETIEPSDTPEAMASAEPEPIPTLIQDEAWIRVRDPEHYTIQVMALSDRDKLKSLIANRQELAPWGIYSATGSRGTVYVLIQGDYPDVESARAARDAFPRRIQKGDELWIRRFAMVQGLLER